MSKKELSAEELLNQSATWEILNTYGDEHLIYKKIKKDLAKTKNYKPNIYYHATGGLSEIGVGRGLYLGKDKKVLDNFYNCDGEDGEIIAYKGDPRFLDLTNDNKYVVFKKNAISLFGKLPFSEELKLLTLQKNHDGIRYYDPIATGEEFVLYNTFKVKKITKQKKNNKEFIL